MRLIDVISIPAGAGIRRVELLQGDLTAIPPEHAVDVLVVSAFKDDYLPNPGTLIGALHQENLSVRELSAAKELDLRSTCSCWLSRELSMLRPHLRFKRILCFETIPGRGRPAERVGDIFRAIVPIAGPDSPITSLAMPIVASGDQGYSTSDILPPLLDAAIHWLSSEGLSLDVIKIVARGDRQAAEAAKVFTQVRSGLSRSGRPGSTQRKYDVFVSYSHKDGPAGEAILEQMTRQKYRVFFDRQSIDIGSSWQRSIYDSVEACAFMVAVYSPDYVRSTVCQEEFNHAWLRGERHATSIIYPILWASTDLPRHMGKLHYADCREQSLPNLVQSCQRIGQLVAARKTSR